MRTLLAAVVLSSTISLVGCSDSRTREESLPQQAEKVQLEERDAEVRARKLIDISARQRALKDIPGATTTSEKALVAAGEIKAPGVRAEVMLEIAKQLADGGFMRQANDAIESARVAIDSIEDKPAAAAATISLAEAVWKMGERDTAATIAASAKPLVEGIPEAEDRVPLLAALAAARMKIMPQPIDEATKQRKPEPLLKAAADEALAITDVPARTRAQARAAAALLAAGNAPEGQAMYDAAVASAMSLTDPLARAYALLSIIDALSTYRTQLPLGELAVAAQNAAGQVTDVGKRTSLQSEIQAARSR